MSNCCPTEKPKTCHSDGDDHTHGGAFDYVLWGSLGTIFAAQVFYLFFPQVSSIYDFAHASIEIFRTMWWGIILGILFVGIMGKIPKEYFSAVLGRGDTFSGIVRATIAGLFLDLCSHGIVMVAAKLYERGASLAQVMAFLIASPWNSLSLTIILVALIGLKWTLLYIAGSACIAIITGMIYVRVVGKGLLPENPNQVTEADDFSLRDDVRARLKAFKPSWGFVKEIVMNGAKEAKMLIRWLLLGVVIAAAIRSFISPEIFAQWFGPTLAGLLLTLVATTIIEVCSEGSAPIASEIFHSARAPGNSFTFLMAGVSTDYTEMMVIREFSKSWKIALSLPLITVPQVVIIGYIMNVMG